jgi:hypothetical protein
MVRCGGVDCLYRVLDCGLRVCNLHGGELSAQ